MRILHMARRSWSAFKQDVDSRVLSFSPLSLRSAGYTLLACATLLGLEVWNTWKDRDASMQQVTTLTTNMTRSLAQHTEDMLDRADTILTELVERVAADGTLPEALIRLDALLLREAQRRPGAASFFVYDQDGRWLASSLPDAPEDMNNADRDYFRHHRESAELGPYVGPLIHSRSRNVWILTLSRRLQTADGRFAGVALATIDAEYFTRFFAGFDLGHQGAAALFRTDGLLLSRQPFLESEAGRSYAHLPLFRNWLPTNPAATYWIASPFDGVIRLNSYRRTDHYPLVLAAAISRHEALASWQREVVVRLAATSFVTLVLALLGLRLARQVQQRHTTEQALAESEAKFRLLAENSSDMVSRLDLDGRRRYVSPAAERLLGCSAAELVGRPADEYIHPEDKAALQTTIAQLKAGSREDATVSYRIRLPSGQELWLESSIRATYHPITGELDGAVAVSRDITERRKLEQQLAELANTDGLTGLSNRRAFDEALDQEWRRAIRNGQPISLLLADVDRFKQYNDTYGHQKGDQCLEIVSSIARSMIRRTGDMAARYGGEEIAILLPNTTALGALDIAERLRGEVEAAQLPHQGNKPSGVITASIGVAGIVPDEATAFGPEALLAAADSALYAAKHEGRNRVRLAAEVPPRLITAPIPRGEEDRLRLLDSYVSTGAVEPGDPELDRIARLAARLFNVPTATISLIGEQRQFFASRVAFEPEETARDIAFCAHVMDPANDILVVPDAAADGRFASNPLVTEGTRIRFYAGAALVAPGTQHRLGALCVMDQAPHPPLDPLQQAVLKDLAALAVSRMEQRRQSALAG